MGNPIQSIPNLPPAIAVSGAEQLWINQAGVDRRIRLSQLGTVGGGGSGAPEFSDYASLRASSFPPSVASIFLNDIYKGGTFVRGPSTLPDNGGTRVKDASGQMWWRLYDERINAAWFYSGPPDPLGNPTTLGSGPATITAADQAANPQWVGLADDGGTGVQTAQPYPVGTYWDFVCLQEWIYACAAERSVPQSTFIGEMNNDGRVTITQWLTGPQSLGVGQPITGAGVAPGTFVTAASGDPNVYWVATNHNTGGLDIDTDRGTHFRGWVEGVILTASGFIFTGPPLQAGDELIDPTYPPNSYYNGVLPGTVVGPQIDGPPGGGLGQQADWYIGIKQSVPSTTMTAVGGPTWNKQGGESYRNVPGFCPRGLMYLNQMLVCSADGLDLFFASKLGTILNWYGNATGTTNVGPAFKFNTLDYSVVKSLRMNDVSAGGVSNYLVSISHTASTPGLNVQNNTFHDWIISGNYATSKCAVAVSPEGGAAQGDSQTFLACFAFGFDDGFTFGGDNAIAGAFFAGQTQSCPRYGVAAFGGSYSAYTMITENNAAAYNYFQTPQRSQLHLGGADFFQSTVSSESSTVIGCRSEAWVGMIDYSRESQVTTWTSGGYFYSWGPNGYWTPQFMLSVENASVGSHNTLDSYDVVMMADDGGPPWMQSDPSSTTTVLTFNPSPGWTPNQWAGFGIWLLSGRNSSSNFIVSNTANTVTLGGSTAAAGVNWWKIFGFSGGAAPNWGATTRYGQFLRNASGWGATIAKGFNLMSTATGLVAGDWVMLPNLAVFPDGSGVTMALSGKVENQHPASSGWYYQSFNYVANIWGAPTNPILLGASAEGNYLTSQISGTPGGVGQYGTAFNEPVGADFTGSITGSFLTVTAVNNGSLSGGLFLGGAGLATAPAPKIASPGVNFNGFIDDGTGGTTKGTVLTVQSLTSPGVIRPGTPLTGGIVAPGTVILSQIGGTPGGVGTYNVSGSPQLVGAAAFTGSIDPYAVLTVSAISAGMLVPGQVLLGPSIPPTALYSQVSGTHGGIGTYNTGQGQNPAQAATSATWQLAAGGMASQFTATVDNGAGLPGNILTVTAISGGVLGIGQTVNVPLTGGPAGLTAQATIVGSRTDTGTGGTGTYTLSGLGSLLVPSSAMTANTTGGIGVYSLTTPLGSPVASEPMLAGAQSSTPPLWEIVDNLGHPVNAATYGGDAFGYWSAGIPDGNLTHMVIDFDVMYGVGGMDQCQLSGYGKVSNIGRMDNPYLPGDIVGQGIRPGEGYAGQFSYKTGAQYAELPRFGVTASTTPFVIPADFLHQTNVYCTVSATNTVLGLVPLGPGLTVDYDLWLTPQANIVGGMIVQWGPGVRAVAPTVNIGQGGQNTLVRLKWTGNGNAAAPGGTWWVMSVEGPM